MVDPDASKPPAGGETARPPTSSHATPSPKVSLLRKLGRALAWFLALLVLLAALLAAGLAWLTSGPGLRWLASHPLEFGATHLEVEDVRGSLWGELRMGRLQVQSPRVDLDVRDLHLRWNPRALLAKPRLLDVQALSIGQLDVTLLPSPSSGPPVLPQSLALPLGVRIDALHIGALRMGAPGALRSLGGLDASVQAGAQNLRLRVQATTPWGDGQARVDLGTTRPFALRGHVQAALRLRGETLLLTMQPSGSLQHLRLRGQASAVQAQAGFEARLAPFSSQPLREAHISANHVDPARIVKGAPSALLDLRLALQPSNAQDVRGSLSLRNAQPGAVNAGRLPLESLRAVLRLQPGRLRIDDLHAGLAGGGELVGGAQWDAPPAPGRSYAAGAAPSSPATAGGRFSLELQARNLDLRRIDSTLLATRLHGPLQLHGSLQRQELQARLEQPGWVVALRASRDGGRIDIAQARLQAQGGRLDASGTLDTRAPQRFDLKAAFDHFDPSRFGAYPAATLNLDVQAQGDVQTRSARVKLNVRPSRWRGHVFSGQARGQVSPAGVRGLQAALLLGDNKLDAQGDFGRAGDSLQWRIDAPALREIDPGFAGRLQGRGTLSGTFAAPAGSFDLHAAKLEAPGRVRADALDASGRLQAGAQGRLDLQLKGHGITAGTFALQQAEVQAQGRLDAQRISLRLRNAELDLRAALQGGYTAAKGWQGTVEQLSNGGRYAVQLLGPAQLLLEKNHVEVRHARLRSGGGDLDLDHAVWNAGTLDTAGDARGIDPAYWLKLLGVDMHGVRSSLRFDAGWAIQAGNTLSGHLQVARSAGDLSLPTDPRLSLGLSNLRLQLRARADAVSATFDAAGSLLGSVHGEMQTRVERRGSAWGIAGTAPLVGALRAELPGIAWAAPLLGPTAKLGGGLALDMKAAGSVASPELSGQLTGRGLALALPDEGLDLRGGVLDASFTGDSLRLTRFTAEGGQGQLTASGSAKLVGGKPQAQLQFTAQQLQVLNRPDRQAVVSGTGTLSLQGRAISLDGKLKVDSANVALPRGSAPKLARDVVIVGRQAQTPTASPMARYAVSAAVQVDLGREVHITGYGLDADLGGRLTLHAATGSPLAAAGSIEVRQGTYTAYGQTLTLVQGGTVNFSGPIDNPGLNFAAQRKDLPVLVGVQVTGTLRTPVVTLTSTPPMPDSEILSWLVLGQDLNAASPDKLALLQTAAGALLASGQGAPVTSRIANSLGLSQLSFSGQGGLQNSIVTLGKRITSKLSVSVERGLGTTGNLFNIRYDFTRRLSLRLQSGSDSAVDMFYTFRFD